MSVKLWAALASLVFGALLIVVALTSFGPKEMVAPRVRIVAEQKAGTAPSEPRDVIKSRSQLQQEATVADGKRSLDLSSGRARLAQLPGRDPTLPEQWLEAERNDPPGLLQTPGFRSGVSSLPNREANVLVQPQGRDFRRNHNDRLRYGGGWLIFGVCFALALFLLGRGRIRIAGGESGIAVRRFNAFERATHWMTASAFLVMGMTGLVILYGKTLLLPLIGPSGFHALAQASAWTHMASTVPFVLGLLLMIVVWVGGNLPSRVDWNWLKQGGGLLRNGEHPPARRFNAGQKIVFWGVVLGGLGMLATGIALMLPFYWLGYTGMQWAQMAHAGIGLGMVALILGHIYIGTVGMVGAFQAMWSGLVDRNWMKEHHALYLEELEKNRWAGEQQSNRPAPAE